MMDSTDFIIIDSKEMFDAATARSEREPVVLYKHSTACGLSVRARSQLKTLTETIDSPIYEVVVQSHRALSDAIAYQLDVRHETPQVIVIHRGQAVFDTSHWRVQTQVIRSTVEYLTSVP